MKVSLLIIGDELLNGRIHDLNGAWLAKYLFTHGYELSLIQIVRDNEKEIHSGILTCLEKSEVVITSGGIGPTEDDLTKKSIASFFGKNLTENPEAIPVIKQNYQYYKRDWTPESNSYHFVPEDFFITPNPCGLAPGLGYYDNQRKKLVFSAPGVPQEFKAIFKEQFIPIIHKYFKGQEQAIKQITIRSFGVPEEDIFFKLCPNLWDELSKFGKVSSLPQKTGIDILVTFPGTEDEKVAKLSSIQSIIEKTPLKDHIWQYGSLSLHELLLKTAQEKGVSMAFAESCTGGLAASYMTDIPGSSKNFFGSVVSYSNQMKQDILEVQEQTIKEFGAVSIQSAKEMALGIQKRTHADYVLAFSGIAGPDGGTSKKPVGTLALAWGNSGKIEADIFHFKGDRLKLKQRFCEFGFLKLLREMQSS